MKNILTFFLGVILLSVSSCTKNDVPNESPYLDLMDVDWQRKSWNIDGEIDGKVITSTKTTDGTIYVYDEERDTYSWTVGLRIFYHEKETEYQPIPENVLLFMIYNVDYVHNALELRKIVNGNFLTSKAFVRFLDGEDEGRYILHVNYDGKDYELKGYPKD